MAVGVRCVSDGCSEGVLGCGYGESVIETGFGGGLLGVKLGFGECV